MVSLVRGTNRMKQLTHCDACLVGIYVTSRRTVVRGSLILDRFSLV